MDRTVTISEADFNKVEKEHNAVVLQNTVLKRDLTRALLLLKTSTEYYDTDISDVDEFEEKVVKFISITKRDHKI